MVLVVVEDSEVVDKGKEVDAVDVVVGVDIVVVEVLVVEGVVSAVVDTVVVVVESVSGRLISSDCPLEFKFSISSFSFVISISDESFTSAVDCELDWNPPIFGSSLLKESSLVPLNKVAERALGRP